MCPASGEASIGRPTVVSTSTSATVRPASAGRGAAGRPRLGPVGTLAHHSTNLGSAHRQGGCDNRQAARSSRTNHTHLGLAAFQRPASGIGESTSHTTMPVHGFSPALRTGSPPTPLQFNRNAPIKQSRGALSWRARRYCSSTQDEYSRVLLQGRPPARQNLVMGRRPVRIQSPEAGPPSLHFSLTPYDSLHL